MSLRIPMTDEEKEEWRDEQERDADERFVREMREILKKIDEGIEKQEWNIIKEARNSLYSLFF